MIKTFAQYLKEIGEVGYIQSIVHSIVYVSGLPGARPKEMVIAQGGQRGIVQGLQADVAEVLMLDTQNLVSKLPIARTNEKFTIPVSEGLLGRVIDAFAQSIDGAGPITGNRVFQPIEPSAPGINQRAKVNRPLETGVTLVDLLVPIGYGQRELLIGDKKTGKTALLLQTIANQASQGIVCVYVSIGKRKSEVKSIETYLRKKGVFQNCVLLLASAADPATMVYLSAYTGQAIAEFFRDMGKDVVIVFDDLTNHAKYYREISLLLKRTPGRSSYPGDIFHLHAALLERAGNIKQSSGNVSITALPVAETLNGDLTGYIQTNLMAITDGHIYFDINEFEKGARPAINASLSVSRVGNQTKTQIDREIAQILRENMASYQKALEIARFGVELPEKTKANIDFGEKIEIIFNQQIESIFPRYFQLLLIGLLIGGFWGGKNSNMVKVDVLKLGQKYLRGEFTALKDQIEAVADVKQLTDLVKKYFQSVSQDLYV